MKPPEQLSADLVTALARSHDGSGIELQIAHGPHWLDGIGFVADLVFCDSDTFEGPAAELVVLAAADVRSPAAALARLRARVEALTRADLDGDLATLLDLANGPAEFSTRSDVELAAAAGTFAARLPPTSWTLPASILALGALLDAATSFERAVLDKQLFFHALPFLRAVTGDDLARETALEAQRRDHPAAPSELVLLFAMQMALPTHGYWFDAPDRPRGPCDLYRANDPPSFVSATPCEIAAAAAKLAPQPGLLAALEIASLVEAARFFDSFFASRAA